MRHAAAAVRFPRSLFPWLPANPLTILYVCLRIKLISCSFLAPTAVQTSTSVLWEMPCEAVSGRSNATFRLTSSSRGAPGLTLLPPRTYMLLFSALTCAGVTEGKGLWHRVRLCESVLHVCLSLSDEVLDLRTLSPPSDWELFQGRVCVSSVRLRCPDLSLPHLPTREV